MDKEQTAIERLRAASEMSLAYYEQPLVVTTSGGKDSAVICELAHRAGIPYEVWHNHTTADAPETVRYVRQDLHRIEQRGGGCEGVKITYPTYKGERVSMWSLIPRKLLPPTRLMRYCCAILKEQAGGNRFIATGVRWAESVKRRGRGIYETMTARAADKIILANDNDDKRQLFESCQLKGKRVVNPIIDWTDSDVWDYIDSERIPVNPLYSCGFSRVGCIGCPMAGQKGQEREFARYPKYKAMYISSFGRMLDARKAAGKDTQWRDAVDVYDWWMEYRRPLPGQLSMEDVIEEGDDK